MWARLGRAETNILLRILPHNLPSLIRAEILATLFEATAEAFGCSAPAYDHLGYAERLRTYAEYTRDQADNALRTGCDIPDIKTRLYQNAYALSARLRGWFRADTIEEVMALGQIFYRAIGVEIYGDAQGDLTVRRCYFSRFYSGSECALISALDDGFFAGLSGGGRLVFSERLTEGGGACRARLQSNNGAHR